MTLSTEIFKGQPEYSVIDQDGTLVARAHCVQVQAGLFTVVVGGKWKGVLPEAQAVAFLKGLC